MLYHGGSCLGRTSSPRARYKDDSESEEMVQITSIPTGPQEQDLSAPLPSILILTKHYRFKGSEQTYLRSNRAKQRSSSDKRLASVGEKLGNQRWGWTALTRRIAELADIPRQLHLLLQTSQRCQLTLSPRAHFLSPINVELRKHLE